MSADLRAPAASAVVAVAVSGGRDSTALLHAVMRACAGSAIQVLALHVHHGLMPEADGWVQHLSQQCRRWRARIHPRLSFQVERLSSRPGPGESVEAWARKERYAALARMARDAGAAHVLLAQHRADQAETVLLQALRGAGPAGLSAMPAVFERHGLTWHRPWLNWPSSALAAYAKRFRLSHIEDPSNADPRFDRNRLRHQVMPVLHLAFPQVEHSLQQVAAQAQAAQALIAEVAHADLCAVQSATGGLLRGPWLSLSPSRRRFALRAWLQQIWPVGRGLHEALLSRLLNELPGARNGARWPAGGGLELGLQRDALCSLVASSKQASNRRDEAMTDPSGADLAGTGLNAQRPGRYAFPSWGGVLEVVPVSRAGLSAKWLTAIRLRCRQGGEQFQLASDRPPRSLKKQYQAAGIPAWARCAPLVYGVIDANGTPAGQAQLLLVPGLGLDARVLAAAGEPQWDLRWLPDEDSTAGRSAI